MSSRLDFFCTNNQTEYEALLFGLIMLRSMEVKHVEAYGDSLQVVYVAPGFKNKTRYTPYVSPGSQISHIATNKGNINRQCLNT